METSFKLVIFRIRVIATHSDGSVKSCNLDPENVTKCQLRKIWLHAESNHTQVTLEVITKSCGSIQAVHNLSLHSIETDESNGKFVIHCKNDEMSNMHIIAIAVITGTYFSPMMTEVCKKRYLTELSTTFKPVVKDTTANIFAYGRNDISVAAD